MGRLPAFIKWIVGGVGAMIALATQVGPDEANSRISEWLRVIHLDGFAAHLNSANADDMALGVGILLIVVAILLRLLDRRDVDFNGVKEWSVSADIGKPGVSVRNGVLDRYLLEICEFRNHSTVQSREVEVRLFVPYFDGREALQLWATRDDDLPDDYGRKRNRDRFQRPLRFPVRIEPNSTREGYIDFEVPGGIDADDLDWVNPSAEIVERRAVRRKLLKPGHVYNALTRRQYRGTIDKPLPISQPWFKRQIARLRATASDVL